MHLIAPLVSGIAGAGGGTAEIYRRGTSTRATYYTDFEATASVSNGADVSLDSNGGASVYVNELVNVIVKDSDGNTVRTFVAGDAASAVEYQGQSFSGTHYVTGESGTGSGYPSTVQAIFDRWLTSAGADDFEVLVDNVATTLQTAVGGLGGMVFNVKSPTYGAVGDGVTNDSTAIDAALTAATANGGVLYFPPGNYRRTTKMTLPAKVSLMGAGPNASSITIDHASNTLLESAGSTTYDYQHVAGLRFTAAQANSGNTISILGGSKIAFSNCYVGGSNCDGTLVLVADSASTGYRITDCTFEIGSTGAAAVSHSGSARRGIWRGCRFIAPAGAYSPTPAAIMSANNVDVSNCVFDGSAATGGTFSYFLASSTTVNATLSGCQFLSTGGGTATAITLGTYTATAVFSEVGSTFGASGVTAYSYTCGDTSEGAHVQLYTRETRVQRLTSNDVNPTLDTDQYGTIIITRTSSANQAWNARMPPDGAQGVVIAYKASGGGTPTVGPDSESTTVDGFKKEDANDTLSDGSALYVYYRAAIINDTLCLLSTTSAATGVLTI